MTLLLPVLLAGCMLGREEVYVQECVADDCACTSDRDCVIDDCYYYVPRTEDDCFEISCSCANGWPAPWHVHDEAKAARDDMCVGPQIPAPDSCYNPCQNTLCEYEAKYVAECRGGACVGVEYSK